MRPHPLGSGDCWPSPIFIGLSMPNLSALHAARLALSTSLVLPAALGALAVMGANDALAACSPDPAPASGAVVVCDADDGDGFTGGSNIDLTVLSGVSVTGGGTDAISLDNGATITNLGSIEGVLNGINVTDTSLINSGNIRSTNGNGIQAGTITSLTNSGTIAGDVSNGIQAGTIISLINSETITGAFDGIQAGTITSLINSGTITGVGDDGIQANTIASLINSGTIEGNRGGVSTLNNGPINSLINSGRILGRTWGVSGALTQLVNSGTIASDNDGIQASTITSLINSGTITGVGSNGIEANTIASLSNSGTIEGRLAGITTTNGPINSLINSGRIIGGNWGVITPAGSDLTQLVNSGTIESAQGVVVGGNIATVTNSGMINGTISNGLTAENITTLINSGTIQGALGAQPTQGGIEAIDAVNIGRLVNSGFVLGGSDGILVRQTIGSLINTGTILADQVDSRGIQANGIITSLFNAGIIQGGTTGIRTSGISNLINAGLIQGGTFAINENGVVDSNYTLNAGSVLIGRVQMGAGTNIVNLGAGLSLNSTFESDSGASRVQLGTTNGHLVAQVLSDSNAISGVDSVQVVAVDSSAFASFDDALTALTGGIGGVVQSRQAAVRSDPALGFASNFASRFDAGDETSLAAFSYLDLNDAPHMNPNRFWIEGFGAFRQDENDRVGSDFDHLTGGLVAGFDVPLDATTSVGVMGGFAIGSWQNETSTQDTDSMSYYGGIYASTQAMGLAWDASLTVGHTDYDAERITANNLVATGLETARADFGGWFISPQVTVTNRSANPFAGVALGTLQAASTLEQSLTLRYAGLFMDGYTETGTTNPLTLDDRSIHLASARASVALPFEAIHDDGALTTLRLIGGVEARTQFGDDSLSGRLLGQSVSTTLDNDTALGGFIGLAAEYQTSNGLTAYADAAGMLETDRAYQLTATAGIKVTF